jgi:hypothetical protein
MCNKELTLIDGFETIGGQEAHIRSPKLNGPRHDPAYSAEKLESYENRVLMCEEHHTLIDANPDVFPAETLEALKAKHEQRVDRALNPKRGKGWVREPEMQMVVNGTQLMGLAHAAHAYMFGHDHPETQDEQDAIGRFLQYVQDWSDISDEIGPSGRIEAAVSLHAELLDLQNLGFVVFAGLEDYRYEENFLFPTIAVHVARASLLQSNGEDPSGGKVRDVDE